MTVSKTGTAEARELEEAVRIGELASKAIATAKAYEVANARAESAQSAASHLREAAYQAKEEWRRATGAKENALLTADQLARQDPS